MPDRDDALRKEAMRALIERGHAKQTRNGGRVPYWIHPQSVAEVLAHAFAETGELAPGDPLAVDLHLAAQGHDLYEDTDVAPEEVRDRFGARVDSFIRGMTNERGDHDRAVYVAHVTAAPEEVRLIKLCDLIDNALSCAYGLHDLGSSWARTFFVPIAGEMRSALASTSFPRFPRTAEVLGRRLDFALAMLTGNIAKFERIEQAAARSGE